MDERHLARLGGWIASGTASRRPGLAVGSSCVEYALIEWWRQSGRTGERPAVPSLAPTPALVVVSGSGSPVTERQIRRAADAGFAEVALDTIRWVRPETRSDALRRALAEAEPSFQAGRSVIFHTALGPRDPRLKRTTRVLKSRRLGSAAILGAALGELLAAALERTGWPRGVVTGGDTSGFAARALGIESLEFAAPIAPGAPLCRIRAPGRAVDGREVVFKGGQNGRDDFLLTALRGEPPPVHDRCLVRRPDRARPVSGAEHQGTPR